MKKALGIIVKSTIKKTVMLLPRQIRFKLYRSKFNLPVLPEGIHFKRAENQGEYEAATKLLYHCYRETNFVKDDPVSKRITKYNLLPTTALLVAKFNDEVIATFSLIVDEAFGLPTENLGNKSLNNHIMNLRKRGDRIVEVSGLAVTTKFRKRILPHLFCYVYQYSRHILGADHLLMNIEPRSAMSIDIYEGILGFKVWNRKGIPYKYVNEAKMVGMTLCLDDAEAFFKKYYLDKGRADIYDYFLYQRDHEHFKFPKADGLKACNNVFDEAHWDNIFASCSKIWEDMYSQHKERIFSAYEGSRHNKTVKKLLFLDQKFSRGKLMRVKPRWITHLHGTIQNPQSKLNHPVKILDVSATGLKVRRTQIFTLSEQDLCEVHVVLENKLYSLRCKVVWRKGENFGLHIQSAPRGWRVASTVWNQSERRRVNHETMA